MKKLLIVALFVNAALLAGRAWQELRADAQDSPVVTHNGDVDGNGTRNIGDAIYLLEWLFRSGPEPIAIAESGQLLARVEDLITDIRNLQGRTATLDDYLHAGLNYQRVTLNFEDQYLDLDTGRIIEVPRLPVPSEFSGGDVRIAYNAPREIHSVVLQNQRIGVEIARLSPAVFEDVCDGNANFTTELIDEPFGPDTVVLVRTDKGVVFKLGRPVEPTGCQAQTGIHLLYQRL